MGKKQAGVQRKVKFCNKCGCMTEFSKDRTGPRWRCDECRKGDVKTKQRSNKVVKCESRGGTFCWVCGYDKTPAALDLHHTDKTEKDHSVGNYSALWKQLIEAKKCAVLCRICHVEAEQKILDDERWQIILTTSLKKLGIKGYLDAKELHESDVDLTKYQPPVEEYEPDIINPVMSLDDVLAAADREAEYSNV